MEVLFLDEPTVGLDVIMRHTLLDSIRDEVRRGLTVVFTTHNLEEADYLCDRVAVIDEGRILVLDSTENLKRLYGGKKTDRPAPWGVGNVARFFSALTVRCGTRAERHGERSHRGDPHRGPEGGLSLSRGALSRRWVYCSNGSTYGRTRSRTCSCTSVLSRRGGRLPLPNLLRLIYRNILVNTDPGSLVILIGLPGMYLVFFGFGFVDHSRAAAVRPTSPT